MGSVRTAVHKPDRVQYSGSGHIVAPGRWLRRNHATGSRGLGLQHPFGIGESGGPVLARTDASLPARRRRDVAVDDPSAVWRDMARDTEETSRCLQRARSSGPNAGSIERRTETRRMALVGILWRAPITTGNAVYSIVLIGLFLSPHTSANQTNEKQASAWSLTPAVERLRRRGRAPRRLGPVSAIAYTTAT